MRLSILICLLLSGSAFGQGKFLTNADSLNQNRIRGIMLTESVLLTGTMIGLNELWYKDYPRTTFHSFDDSREWLQMDKIGHAMTAYYVGWANYKVVRWAGAKKTPSIWYGGLLGVGMLSIVEVLDGFSEEWGFSWTDFATNAGGYALFGVQQQLWDEQRFQLKFSFHPTDHQQYRPALLGASILEQSIKNYNGQTYWLSFNPMSFAKESKIPKWVNLSIGYSADGMIGGTSNPILIKDNGQAVQFKRTRQWYLSMDIDFRSIKTKKPWQKVLLGGLGFFKIPFPAIGLEGGKFVAKPLYF